MTSTSAAQTITVIKEKISQGTHSTNPGAIIWNQIEVKHNKRKQTETVEMVEVRWSTSLRLNYYTRTFMHPALGSHKNGYHFF